MTNILLVFLNDISRTEEFNEIIDKFAENDYTIYLLDNIKDDEYFSIDSLPELVELNKEQHEKINKVVVLSNARDLIFSWYRCYNSLIDDFIYFVDEDEKNYFGIDDQHYLFQKHLSQFGGIEEEMVSGKIYINLNFNNYEKIIEFLIQDNNFRYFDSLDTYEFNKDTIDRTNISKKYIYNKYEYNFIINNNESVESVNMSNVNGRVLEINKDSLEYMLDNIYIIPYMTALLYKAKGQAIDNLLVMIYKNLKGIDKHQQRNIFEELFTYIRSSDIDFKEKIYISSLLVMINNGDERLTELIMETLLKDVNYMEYHYPVMYNILFYTTNENLKINNKVYIKMREEMIRLGEFYKKKGGIKVEPKENKDGKIRIAIHYDQLLSIKHTPTSLALNIAKNLRTYCNNCEVKIFVEDNFVVNSDEILFPYVYSSAISHQCRKIHEEYLESYDVEVYYSDTLKNKVERTKEIINEVNRFNPNIIYSTSDISLAREILYPYYPIVYQTHGGTNFSTLCDAYVLYGNSQKEKLLQINNDIKLIDESIIYINEQPISYRKHDSGFHNRAEMGIKEDGFTMVTVGNRLEAELNQEFIDMICSFIQKNNNIYWIIVGPNAIPYIENRYKDLIDSGRIVKIDFEEKLYSLYRICDVYINPARNGGAGSVVMAMEVGLPSIIEKNSQDAVFVIGEENCVENDKVAYMNELRKLYMDEDYRNYRSKLMKEIIANKRDWKIYIETYLDIFDLVIDNSKNRIK